MLHNEEIKNKTHSFEIGMAGKCLFDCQLHKENKAVSKTFTNVTQK